MAIKELLLSNGCHPMSAWDHSRRIMRSHGSPSLQKALVSLTLKITQDGRVRGPLAAERRVHPRQDRLISVHRSLLL